MATGTRPGGTRASAATPDVEDEGNPPPKPPTDPAWIVPGK